ncbi:MAG: threonylcarbamoyl-AMP synthase [Coprobacillus sp.]|nr:threonylcarbamoyl-AMP synthase [Coprobacillus sp.]
MTNRKLYFSLLEKGKDVVTEKDAQNLLIYVNKFNSLEDLMMHLDDECLNEKAYLHYGTKLIEGMPLAYVIHEITFGDLKLYIDENVLVPRIETCDMCEEILRYVKERFGDEPISILDIGTGSGAIALYLKKHLPNATIVATDISHDALEVAKKNAKLNKLDVTFLEHDMTTPFRYDYDVFDIIVSNPPYISSYERVQESVYKYEPSIALFTSDRDKYYHEILNNFSAHYDFGTMIYFEMDDGMGDEMSELVHGHIPHFAINFYNDSFEQQRFVSIKVLDRNIEYDPWTLIELKRDHKAICFPTETVLGLGVIAKDVDAYDLLNDLKQRDLGKPYSLMLSDTREISNFAELDDYTHLLVNSILPGPYTLLLPTKKNLSYQYHSGLPTIGIRIPNDRFCLNLIEACGPMLVTSANVSGEDPITTINEAKEAFGEDDVLYIGEDRNETHKPTSIIQIKNHTLRIIREGEREDLYNLYSGLKKNYSMTSIVVASDHAGYEMKQEILKYLASKPEYVVTDAGTYSEESCDYPEFAQKAAEMIVNGEAEYGILVCGTGEGISIAANKVKGVRCGIGYSDDVTELMRQHNDANMIAFGGRTMQIGDVLHRIDIFLNTSFLGERHQKRVDKIE